ncbi:suppressor of fused domain protein [Streptomyces caatingaensis]|uniref:Suppressor of fused domain protein n=1 Tax=Streptomyces caatingaensis TaxID=1678637 RepID=A0A0K9XF02_9ACTN|nr:suppressor of fused domain protein [Streptomyces caatingaensis]KNB52009.1 Suppressor of fused domain protein [Streptomyces caatingaensis]
MSDVLALVEARLHTTFGEPDARAAVTFLGADRIEVLRFTGPADGNAGEDVVRYVTLGMSAQPMADPGRPSPGGPPSPSGFAAPLSVSLADPVRGPRAELVLTVRPGRADTDKVLRPLAVLAASPQVEGLVVAPGASLDTGEPLWPGAPFTSVLVAEPGGLVEDLELDAPMEPVRFLPLLPMTPNEAAWKRVQGAAALRERWLRHGTDLRDPLRAGVPLG